MDYETLHSWEQEIEATSISNDKKLAMKRYVHNILEQNGVVIIDVEHFSLLLGIENEVLCRMINSPEKFIESLQLKNVMAENV